MLANPTSFSGTTTVKGGSLIVGATGGTHSLIGGGPIVLENAGTMLAQWAIGGSNTFANAISGIGASDSAATNLVINGCTLRNTSAAVITDRLFSVCTASELVDAPGTGAVQRTHSGSMGFHNQTGTHTLVFAGISS